MSDSFVDLYISLVNVMLRLEVRSLRALRNNMVWDHLAQNFITQSSPKPLFIASLSYQSTSAPSRLLFKTNSPSLRPQTAGSSSRVVGNSESPNALTMILIPALLQILLRLFWISSVVLPKEFPYSKQLQAFAHTIAISFRFPSHVQEARAIQLQIWGQDTQELPRRRQSYLHTNSESD